MRRMRVGLAFLALRDFDVFLDVLALAFAEEESELRCCAADEREDEAAIKTTARRTLMRTTNSV